MNQSMQACVVQAPTNKKQLAEQNKKKQDKKKECGTYMKNGRDKQEGGSRSF